MDTESSGEHESAPYAVKPVGVFGVLAGQRDFRQLRSALQALAGALPQDERTPIVRYLRAGSIVFAIMEHTEDVLNGSFRVPGGSGLVTDGAYYWRYDAADYVERYGISLPDDFLRHGRAMGWLARPMAEEDILGVYDHLKKYVCRVRSDGKFE